MHTTCDSDSDVLRRGQLHAANSTLAGMKLERNMHHGLCMDRVSGPRHTTAHVHVLTLHLNPHLFEQC